MACINMSNIFEIKRRMRARERRRKFTKNFIIGILVTVIGIFPLGLSKRENRVKAYDYDTCTTLWGLAEKHCPESVDKRDFIEEVKRLNAMPDYIVYPERLYQYPIYAESNSAIVFAEETEPKVLKSLGIYTLTAYCPCRKCCGKWANGITASGATAKAGHTIAAPKDIPFGTVLVIDGVPYTVEDRGGSIRNKKLDIFFNTHAEAKKFGKRQCEVFIYE